MPVIKVTTHLVQVDVVVRDAKGSVPGLTRDDFRLFDQGKSQKIALFQVNRAVSEPWTARNASPSQAKAFTNHIPDTGSATVILLDQLMTSVMDQRDARLQLLKYLEKVQPQDRIAIYLLGAGVQLVQPFKGDSASLGHSLEVQRFWRGLLAKSIEAGRGVPERARRHQCRTCVACERGECYLRPGQHGASGRQSPAGMHRVNRTGAAPGARARPQASLLVHGRVPAGGLERGTSDVCP
jgi:VWFA-related protein